MFTMAKIRDGSTYLREHLSANDYYAEGERVVGQWRGKAAEVLGLSNRAVGSNDASFEALRKNLHPETGQQLTERTAKTRIAFLDFQCSAPKSVSLLAVTFGDDRLRQAHESAANEAFSSLEHFAARRVRQGAAAWSDTTRVTGNLCAAAFTHDASRALDAQLHTHFVTVNATYDSQEGRWFALTESEMLKTIRFCGKIYQNSLARAVIKAGYDIDYTRDERGNITGFEIRGVSEEDRATASRRRTAIDDAIRFFERERGRHPTKREVDQIVRETRGDKLLEISTPEVRRRQLAAFTESRQLALRAVVAKAVATAPVPPVPNLSAAMAHARDHLFERQSAVVAHELIAEVLNQNLGGVDVDHVLQALTAQEAGICTLRPNKTPELAVIGTTAGVRAELEMIEFLNAGLGMSPALGKEDFRPPDFLSDSQRTCVSGILSSRDTVTALRGVAGAGKTTVLAVIESGLKENSVASFYCAPTASAAGVLKSEGFDNATTLADFLLQAERKHGDQLRGALIVVDEAGLISNRQGAELFALARRCGARILLVGDSRQHSAVEAGDFLGLLETHSRLRAHELTDIRRQIVAAYREAIKTISCGRAREGLVALDSLGFIQEAGNDYIDKAAKAYQEFDDKDVILVAPTWAEIDALTDAIRARKKERGELSEERQVQAFESVKWTAAQKRRAENYSPGMVLSVHGNDPRHGLLRGTQLEILAVTDDHSLRVRDHTGREWTINPRKQSEAWDTGKPRPLKLAVGDKVLIRQNLKSAGLTNGDVLEVKSFHTDGGWMGIDAAGREHTVPATFRAYAHGYAVTSHKSQGRTADHVIVCAARLDAKATYVAFSRGRKSALCFTPDRDGLISGVPSCSANRLSALDVIAPVGRSPIRRATRTHRAWDAFQSLARMARRAAEAARRLFPAKSIPALPSLRNRSAHPSFHR